MISHNQKEIQIKRCFIQTQVEHVDEVVVVETMVVAKQEISSSTIEFRKPAKPYRWKKKL